MWSGITSDSKKHVVTDSEMTPFSGERNFQDLKTAEPKGHKEIIKHSKCHVNEKITSQACEDLCEKEIQKILMI